MNIKGLPMTVITESRGIKPEGEFAIHHIIPCCLKYDSFKGRLHRHSFSSVFFFLLVAHGIFLFLQNIQMRIKR